MEAECLWLEAEHLGAKALQQIEFMVAGSKAKGLYDILQGAMIQPGSLMSVVPPPPKRCRWVTTTMVSYMTVQETKAAVLGTLEQGVPLACPPIPREQHTYWDDTPMCQHRGHPPGLSLPGQGVPWGTLISTHHYLYSWVQCPYGHEAVMFPLPYYIFNTNTFKWHGKQAHCSGSSDPS